MNWFRICKHDRIKPHTLKRFIPDSVWILTTCVLCGKERRFKVGDVTDARRQEMAEIVLKAKGYYPVDQDSGIYERRTA